MQGGASQGAGMALSEEYIYDEDGRLRNASLLDYRMPTTVDLPMVETVLVEVPNPGHPYGVRGVGEVPIVPPLGAIANALHDATGRANAAPAAQPRARPRGARGDLTRGRRSPRPLGAAVRLDAHRRVRAAPAS